MTDHNGRCLCGRVTYRAELMEQDIVACHCSQCARTSGHFAVLAPANRLDIRDPHGLLRWFKSSADAKRGFCGSCGGNLFWRGISDGTSFVTLGTLDRPTNLKIGRHIFVGSKSDYDEISDNLPQADLY